MSLKEESSLLNRLNLRLCTFQDMFVMVSGSKTFLVHFMLELTEISGS